MSLLLNVAVYAVKELEGGSGVPPSTARGVPGVSSDYPPEYRSPQYLNTQPDYFIHSPNIRLISLPTVILTRMSKILANTPLGLIKLIYGRQYSRMKSQQSGISTTSEPALAAPPKYLLIAQPAYTSYNGERVRVLRQLLSVTITQPFAWW